MGNLDNTYAISQIAINDSVADESVGYILGKRASLFLACTYQMNTLNVNYIEERTNLFTTDFLYTQQSEKTFNQLLSLRFGIHIGLRKLIA